MNFDDLVPGPDGDFWHVFVEPLPPPATVVPDNVLSEPDAAERNVLQEPLFFDVHILKKGHDRLRPQYQLYDAPIEERHHMVQQAIERTLNEVRAVTKIGVLTKMHSPNQPSMDYLCHGNNTATYWQGGENVVSVIVRRIPEPANPKQRRSVGITLIAPGLEWRRILQGLPVPRGYATHEIPVGGSFDLELHSVGYHRPRCPIFG